MATSSGARLRRTAFSGREADLPFASTPSDTRESRIRLCRLSGTARPAWIAVSRADSNSSKLMWRCLEALLLLLRCACSLPAPAPAAAQLLLAKLALLLQPLLELADFLLELLPFAVPAQHIIAAPLLVEPLAAPLLLLQAELAVATLLDLL